MISPPAACVDDVSPRSPALSPSLSLEEKEEEEICLSSSNNNNKSKVTMAIFHLKNVYLALSNKEITQFALCALQYSAMVSNALKPSIRF